MKRFLFVWAFLLTATACPKPAPHPVVPIDPAPLTCDTDSQLHDMIVNDVVNALADDTGLDSVVQRYTLATVRCVVQEIVVDADSAPQLVGRAQAWLAANGGN